eukprot:CAMPEP_0181533966 /NCGR_PEP_ID=MMETSP1110-20121109/73449_1 /TAXON_ID=174948 /ORGANISM="Symbiodinium sp., Strain CCMP421" /LENGTH=413 /DNA_ID=CAMNT_0023665205 /DNA_START=54 /DNA_END=1296 /DNA_ORIENTATION=+
MSLPTALLLFIASAPTVLGHGVLTWPPSTRQNGSMAHAGSCAFDDCIWYSDFVTIPGEPLVNKEAHRTFNVKTQSGESDWSRKNPWRAPGTAPIFGSGCGVYGGRQEFVIDSSGNLLGVHLAGKDGANLPAKEPTVWPKGSVQEVAWAITANHGGGYSYRLCPKTRNITEECFQQHVLSFHGDKQWLVYGNMTQMGDPIGSFLPRIELPLVRVTEGTYPAGSEWARNPIPSCEMFSQAECAGLPQQEFIPTLPQQEFITCAQAASGYDVVQCPPGMVQFPEPLPGLSGHVPFWRSSLDKDTPQWSNSVASKNAGDPPVSRGFPFSIADLVQIPEDLPEGEYLLSWRWDCEQSSQVWQNCADIRIVNGVNGTTPTANLQEERESSTAMVSARVPLFLMPYLLCMGAFKAFLEIL